MHQELAALFIEHEEPTHASKDDVHAELRAISRLASNARKQIIEYESLLDDALHAPHDPMYDAKVEHMRQTFGAMAREAEKLATSARDLGQTFAQLERYMGDWRGDIERMDAAKVAPGAVEAVAPA